MQAVDYNVVNVGFLSPDDTEYNTDTEGIFAKNGIYYKLGLVDSTYFTDALFIGDSRTVGLCEYGSLKGTAAFLAKESVNVYNILMSRRSWKRINTARSMWRLVSMSSGSAPPICIMRNTGRSSP